VVRLLPAHVGMNVGAISLLSSLSEVWGVVAADLQGGVVEATSGSPGENAQGAAATAAAMSAFAAAGEVAGLISLEILQVKSAGKTMVSAARPNAHLLVTVDPSRETAKVEDVLHTWATARGEEVSSPAVERPEDPTAVVDKEEPPGSEGAPSASPGPSARDAWAAFRSALARGQLKKAASLRLELSNAAEEVEERERAIEVLLEGIGTVMAGDGVGGIKILRELTAVSQKNVSVRWLALQWSAWAGLKSGSLKWARVYLREALLLARQLDIDARAVSQWTAAEATAQGGDEARALTWLSEARGRFERFDDKWGISRTWLAEARVMVLLGREKEGVGAARMASAADPSWDEPAIFLARRALVRDDLAEAEMILHGVHTVTADRVRGLIEAIRCDAVTRPDASDFLREHEALPSAEAVQVLERIARAAPRFVQARESLAWMLLKLGRYAEASELLHALLGEELTPGDRASVMLGLSCIAHAQQSGEQALQSPVGNVSQAGSDAPADVSPVLPNVKISRNGGPSPVFSGQLSVFALPDLLEFLRSAKRTGLLVCSSATGMGKLHFRAGWIAGASSPSTPRLGQILLRSGLVSEQALEVAATRQVEHPDLLLGELLVWDGLVDDAAVQDALRQQIELTVRELVQWKDGEFTFSGETENQPARKISVELDAQAVLLSLFKDMDEASRNST